jgi:hypothetical protein
MEIVKIISTKHTPEIILDPVHNLISFSGVSFPEDALEVYLPVFDWLTEFDKYKVNNKKTTEILQVTFKLSYYNTSTHRAFLEMFQILKRMHDEGLRLDIKWQYEENDDTMLYNGKDLAELTGLELKYIELK